MILFRLRLIPILGLVTLGSCISVNNVGLTPSQTAENAHAAEIETRAEKIAQQEAMQNPQAAIEASGHSCPLYVLPTLPKDPAPPIAAIEALQDGDQKQLDVIAQTYVKALEKHNAIVKAIVTKSYNDYVTQCAKSLPPILKDTAASTPSQ
jgi:hypothetical protein